VKVENVAQDGDPVKYKVSLEDKVQVGNVTIEGSTDNGNKIGEITGLTNTTLNSADFATTGASPGAPFFLLLYYCCVFVAH